MNTYGTQLLENLATENQAINNLVVLIQQEQSQLINANIVEVEQIIAQKAQHVAKLAELSSQRHAILALAGYESGESGMQSWIDQHSSEHKVNDAWQNLLTHVRNAKAMNHTNGLLINTHLNRNQTTLNVLRGTNKTGNFYGPDGQTTGVSKSRSIVVG